MGYFTKCLLALALIVGASFALPGLVQAGHCHHSYRSSGYGGYGQSYYRPGSHYRYYNNYQYHSRYGNYSSGFYYSR